MIQFDQTRSKRIGTLSRVSQLRGEICDALFIKCPFFLQRNRHFFDFQD